MMGIKSKDLVGHEGPVWNLYHGENNLFSSSSDTTVKVLTVFISTYSFTYLQVWDLNTLKCKHTLRGHEGIVHCVVGYNKDSSVCDLLVRVVSFLIFQAISGSDDRTIKFWDVDNNTCKKTIIDDNITCVLRVNRGHLYSGSLKCLKVLKSRDIQNSSSYFLFLFLILRFGMWKLISQ